MLRPLSFCLTLLAYSLAAADRPNVLLIVADDLGYADVGFQGCKDIPTPHLDALAKASVHCTNGYVSHPFCSPTRAGIMTGRYQHRFGHENNPAYLPEDIKSGLPLDQITLPEILKTAGYTTGMVGKWHLGAHPSLHPNKRGFDEFFGFIGGGHIYLPGAAGGLEYNVPIQFNGESRPFKGYLTDMLGQEAAAFVNRHAGKPQPWFLYLAFNAPHTPLSAPPELLEKFSSIADPSRRSYAAMVFALDQAVGRTIAVLASTGQRENTLIFFVSDNGGPDLSTKSSGKVADNTPLRGAKGQVYDGGIRVPFLISWPAKLKPATYAQPVISLDFMATAAAVTGAKVPQDRVIDSVNLLPHLMGENLASPHANLFWRTNGPGGNYAVREADFKLVRIGKNAPELYNLSTDIGESTNLAATNTAQVDKMVAALGEWEKGTIPPVFSGPKDQGKPKKKGKK